MRIRPKKLFWNLHGHRISLGCYRSLWQRLIIWCMPSTWISYLISYYELADTYLTALTYQSPYVNCRFNKQNVHWYGRRMCTCTTYKACVLHWRWTCFFDIFATLKINHHHSRNVWSFSFRNWRKSWHRSSVCETIDHTFGSTWNRLRNMSKHFRSDRK